MGTQPNKEGDKAITTVGLEDDDDFEEFPAEGRI